MMVNRRAEEMFGYERAGLAVIRSAAALPSRLLGGLVWRCWVWAIGATATGH